jgi:NAD(P)-dependent dehydrogenase (short-subunit alcohol dehydrogenase family)
MDKKIVLITGASRGIGSALALGFAKADYHVVLLARDQVALEALDDKIIEAGGRSTIIPFDLKKLDELEALGPLIDQKFGRLDALIANAGLLGALTPVAHSKMKDWQDNFTVNILANVQLIRTLDPLLRNAPHGKAIFMTSGKADTETAYWGAYGSSKAALNNMVRTYAEETKHSNLRVHLVRPGVVQTDMLSLAYPGGYQGKGLKKPEDLVEPFLELCDPEKQFEVFVDLKN